MTPRYQFKWDEGLPKEEDGWVIVYDLDDPDGLRIVSPVALGTFSGSAVLGAVNTALRYIEENPVEIEASCVENREAAAHLRASPKSEE